MIEMTPADPHYCVPRSTSQVNKSISKISNYFDFSSQDKVRSGYKMSSGVTQKEVRLYIKPLCILHYKCY